MTKSKKFAAHIPIVIGILIAFSGAAHAQQEEDDEEHGLYLEKARVFSGGLVAGANFTQVDGDYFAGYRKIGLNAGAIVYAHLTKHVALSMEILYSQKGSKSDGPQPSPALPSLLILKYGITANYAEVPIMINYFDKRKSHIGVGVSYSTLVNVKESITTDTAVSNTIKTTDLSIQYPFKKDDFNFVVSGQLHLIKGLYLNIRFQYSIIPIRSGADLPPIQYARADQYNNLWVVRLMYLVK
ncbi:MAG: outer membrane beta-barrel protein [Chitinophagales bacterium]